MNKSSPKFLQNFSVLSLLLLIFSVFSLLLTKKRKKFSFLAAREIFSPFLVIREKSSPCLSRWEKFSHYGRIGRRNCQPSCWNGHSSPFQRIRWCSHDSQSWENVPSFFYLEKFYGRLTHFALTSLGLPGSALLLALLPVVPSTYVQMRVQW